MNEKIGYPDIFDNESLLAGEYNQVRAYPLQFLSIADGSLAFHIAI